MPAPIDTRSRAATLAAVALVVVAVLRVATTYPVFNQAYDEPAHIACGMEWLDKGTFGMEPQHPPLPRVMAALGPYLAGLRLPEVKFADGKSTNGYDFYTTGNQILYARGQYQLNLTLARLGTLPFLVIGCCVVFVWARSLGGDGLGLLAVFLFTTLPIVLGYCTLAYVDPALMAMFPAALLALVRWLDAPDWGRSVIWRSLILGAAVAGAALANAPWMVFLPPCFLGILVCRRWAVRVDDQAGFTTSLRFCWRPLLLALAAFCFVLWGGYRFSVQRLDHVFDHPVQSAERIPSPARALALKVVALNPPLPAPEFFKGVANSVGENGKLYPAYLFGKVRRGGWWYFYFFMLIFKTPPTLLLLAAVGVGSGLMRLWNNRDWQTAAPAVSVILILLVSMTIKVNIGMRTILFLYPLLAVAAALGCREIWRLRSRWPQAVPALLIALLAGLAIDGAWIHPNYLTYTSTLAGADPSRSLVLDADFDAGQNVSRLARQLAEHHVDHLKLRIYTSADLAQMGLPPFEILAPYERATGWIAVSVHNLRTGEGPWYPEKIDGYAWLNAYQPVFSVDQTIRVYYVQ